MIDELRAGQNAAKGRQQTGPTSSRRLQQPNATMNRIRTDDGDNHDDNHFVSEDEITVD